MAPSEVENFNPADSEGDILNDVGIFVQLLTVNGVIVLPMTNLLFAEEYIHALTGDAVVIFNCIIVVATPKALEGVIKYIVVTVLVSVDVPDIVPEIVLNASPLRMAGDIANDVTSYWQPIGEAGLIAIPLFLTNTTEPEPQEQPTTKGLNTTKLNENEVPAPQSL
jgi:hypothetical protein